GAPSVSERVLRDDDTCPPSPDSPTLGASPGAEGTSNQPNPAENPDGADHHEPAVSGQIVETLQTVLTALILAFVFRAYLIEAFIIPTGSTAEALVGEHGTRVCPRCGWEYDFGPTRAGYEPGQAFQEGIVVSCPNCHESVALDLTDIHPKSGDRILVHKWPFVLGGWFG